MLLVGGESYLTMNLLQEIKIIWSLWTYG